MTASTSTISLLSSVLSSQQRQPTSKTKNWLPTMYMSMHTRQRYRLGKASRHSRNSSRLTRPLLSRGTPLRHPLPSTQSTRRLAKPLPLTSRRIILQARRQTSCSITLRTATLSLETRFIPTEAIPTSWSTATSTTTASTLRLHS